LKIKKIFQNISSLIQLGLKNPNRIIPYIIKSIYFFFLESYVRQRLKSRTFNFQENIYNYFCHKYNFTWSNERSIEVPIIWDIVKKSKGKILEVGNVLSHYYSVSHDIVDKYEKAKGVINQDIVNFRPSLGYDLIISISTLEHIGWDEIPREPGKILRALNNLKLNCLAPGGKMVITVPLGKNLELDKFLNEDKIDIGKQYYLRRVSKKNDWIEVGWNDVKDLKHDSSFPFYSANGIVIGIYEKL